MTPVQFQCSSSAVPVQFQQLRFDCSFRAIRGQFQCSFVLRTWFDRPQCNSSAVWEPFQGSFEVSLVLEQLMVSSSAISEQLQCSYKAVTYIFNHLEPISVNFRAVAVQFDEKPLCRPFNFHYLSNPIQSNLISNIGCCGLFITGLY